MSAETSEAVRKAPSCSVCLIQYRDPRTLSCAHQFCLGCLGRIAVTRPGGETVITCPICSAVTPIGEEDGAARLPRPDEDHAASRARQGESIPSQWSTCSYCELYGTENVKVSIYCYVCHETMCDKCYTRHQRTASQSDHKTAPVSSLMFCGWHHDLLTLYCHDCGEGVCAKCTMNRHSGHTVEALEKQADKVREQTRALLNQLGKNKDVLPGQQVLEKFDKIRAQREDSGIISVVELREIISLLKQDLEVIQQYHDELETKTASDIEAIQQYQSVCEGSHGALQGMLSMAKHLMNTASDPEVVARGKELEPLVSILKSPTISLPTVRAEAAGKLRGTLVDLLQRSLVDYTQVNVMSHLDSGIKYRKKSSSDKRQDPPVNIYNGKLQELFKVEPKKFNNVYNVLLNPEAQQMILRTDDHKAPIKVYSYSGDLKSEFGSSGGCHLTRYGRMAVDTKRRLYLAACESYGLLILKMDGTRKEELRMPGRELQGVSYSRTKDLYILSDTHNHRIILLDPDTKTVVSMLGGKGINPGQFTYPISICVVDDHRSNPMIAVSEWGNDRIQLVDFEGNYVRMYGTRGLGDAMLWGPHHIVPDQAGRIIACDCLNHRIVCFWSDGGKEHWENVLPSLQEPAWMDIDTSHKLIAINTFGDSCVRVYSYA